MQRIALAEIQMDHGIQCRVGIDMETVSDYVERINAGERAPAIDLFGADGCYWIGDGWHRVMAAQQIKAVSIDAEIHEGGRQDALKHALRANTKHGLRRTNADKRRCVEIAITEFSTLSSRAIAELCGVDDDFVGRVRVKVPSNGTCTVTGADGKQYPAKRKPKENESVGTETQAMGRNTSRAVKVAAIKDLLASGYNIEQISDATGLSIPNVRTLILEYHLTTLKRKGRGCATISPVHVIRETVNAVTATGHGLRLINKMAIDLSKAEAKELLSELRTAMKALGWLVNLLKEKAND